MTLSQLTQKIMGKNNRERSVEYGLNWRLSRPDARPYEAQALLRLGKERSQNYRRVTHLNETGILLFENAAAAVYMGIRPLHSVQSRETGVGILSIADTFEVADEYARLVCTQYDSPIYSAFRAYKHCVGPNFTLPTIRFQVEDAAFKDLPLRFR